MPSIRKQYQIGIVLLLFITFLGCKGDTSVKDKATQDKSKDLLIQGKHIASSTFLALSSELQKAMADGGVPKAVSYCNIRALSITDSLSKAYNVEIKRTSDRLRNPANAATEEELQLIDRYKKELVAGQQLKPQIVNRGDNKVFHAPIITSDVCLKCHGAKENIESYATIANLYPNDLATGYGSGELRGIWSIAYLNNKEKNVK